MLSQITIDENLNLSAISINHCGEFEIKQNSGASNIDMTPNSNNNAN